MSVPIRDQYNLQVHRGQGGETGLWPAWDEGQFSLTISLPRTMFMPQVKVNSPACVGVNSIGLALPEEEPQHQGDERRTAEDHGDFHDIHQVNSFRW